MQIFQICFLSPDAQLMLLPEPPSECYALQTYDFARLKVSATGEIYSQTTAVETSLYGIGLQVIASRVLTSVK